MPELFFYLLYIQRCGRVECLKLTRNGFFIDYRPGQGVWGVRAETELSSIFIRSSRLKAEYNVTFYV